MDLVIGSRFHSAGPSYEITPLKRGALSILRRVTKRLLSQSISDPTSGYQALSGRMVRFYAQWQGFPDDAPDADVLVWVSRCGYRIGEVPVVMHARRGGSSMHDGLEPVIYALKLGLALPLSLTRRVPSDQKATGQGKETEVGS